MDIVTPPITPIRHSMSPLLTSPTDSYREQFRRRHSSISLNHDRSPVSIRKNRFSNASQLSNDFSPDGSGGGGDGMGNLADELDQLDESMDVEGDMTEVTEEIHGNDRVRERSEGARDSGVDVSYSSKKNSPRMKNFSKPFSAKEEPPDEAEEEDDQVRLSPELEEAMSSIARMASSTSHAEDPLIPRTISLLQDPGNQSTLEANTQRLTTSTNSMTSYFTSQSKSIQTLSTSLYSPFAFSTPLDPDIIDEILPLITNLLTDLPHPDPAPLQGLQKLDRETHNITQTLSQLTDTLQMGKHTTNAASRHLRTTQTIVAELRRERERAETARFELERSGWDGKVAERWCAGECGDIVGGFERSCRELREKMENAADGVAV